MKKNINMALRILLVLFGVFLVIGAVVRCRMKIKDQLLLQVQTTLDDISKQNVSAFEVEFEDNQSVLKILSRELWSITRENADDKMSAMIPWTTIYNFERIGFIFPDGMAYTTDGYHSDLSFRVFFKESIKGRTYITSTIKDTVGRGDDINVISMPVYNSDSTIRGVLFATYPAEMFNEMLSVDMFDNSGYSYIVKQNGTTVAGSRKTGVMDANFFDYMLNRNSDNQKVIDTLQQEMEKGRKGHLTFKDSGDNFICYSPITEKFDGETCYIFIMLPASVLSNNTDPILNDVSRMIMLLIVVLSTFIVFYLFQERRQRRELHKTAYTDTLTGDDNYALFRQKLAKKKETSGYFVSIDLSEFKIVNNTCGVEKGNETLRRIWQILRSEVAPHEFAAHINADNFVMFMVENGKDAVSRRINDINKRISALQEELNLPRLEAYFGIYQTTNKTDCEISLSRANEAKHTVKGSRDIKYAFYDEMDFQKIINDKELENSFEDAIKNHEFEVWYQPKFSTHNPHIVGAEALIRWRKPDGTLIPPYRFIPMFEKNGMIADLDEYVFKTVCKQQKKWQNEGKTLIPVSVNISRASLFYSNVVEKYKQLLGIYHLPAKYVPLEITESATVDNISIKELIKQFHDAGFPLLLDDFGTGYSSLATLNSMPFDTLKLDKSLIDYIGDSNGEKLIYYTVKLAKSLDMSITAEGVESQNQVDFLKDLQCNDIQGYFYSKPLPITDFQDMLAS